jgi:hypothetical protein
MGWSFLPLAIFFVLTMHCVAMLWLWLYLMCEHITCHRRLGWFFHSFYCGLRYVHTVRYSTIKRLENIRKKWNWFRFGLDPSFLQAIKTSNWGVLVRRVLRVFGVLCRYVKVVFKRNLGIFVPSEKSAKSFWNQSRNPGLRVVPVGITTEEYSFKGTR